MEIAGEGEALEVSAQGTYTYTRRRRRGLGANGEDQSKVSRGTDNTRLRSARKNKKTDRERVNMRRKLGIGAPSSAIREEVLADELS